MWTRHRPTPPTAKPDPSVSVEAEPPLDPISPAGVPVSDFGADSTYGVRSFEFGGDPRPSQLDAPIGLATGMHTSENVTQRVEDDEDGDEEEEQTPGPTQVPLADRSPPYSLTTLPVFSSMHDMSHQEPGEAEMEMALGVAMEDGDGSDLTVPPHPLQLSGPGDRRDGSDTGAAEVELELEMPDMANTRSAPLFTLHSPNPSSTSGIDTDHEHDHDHDPYTDFDSDMSSAPPSPTSLTSMPSYVASLSSASGSSSPAGPANARTDSTYGIPASGAVLAAMARARHGAELVIPELSLPSSSLHLSLRDWEGSVQGVRVVLLGPAELTKRVIRAIGEREECVSVKPGGRGKGLVGVVKADRMIGILETGVTAEQTRLRVLRTFTTLHGLLNPASQDEQQLTELVRAYSEREDWVHAVIGVHTASRHQAESLNHLVPVIDIPTASSPSSPLGGPTPMPRTDTSGYFDNPTPRIVGDINLIADSIIQALEASSHPSISSYGETLQARSISTFLAWRPPALSSSNSSLDSQPTSTPSGASGMDADPTHLMPTVARAQGGGEWEATLSRRLAQRRDSQVPQVRPGSRRSSNDNERKRRRSQGKKEGVEPLFPPRAASPAATRRVNKGKGSCGPPEVGLGIGSLVISTFKGMGKWTRGWRGAVLAAVVVGVVGLRLYFSY